MERYAQLRFDVSLATDLFGFSEAVTKLLKRLKIHISQ